MEDRDFIDFEFNGHWASEFNLLAVSNSDRYSNSFYGTVNANTADMVGKYGVYKWKTQIGEKRFSINIAYDNVDLNTLRKIKEWLNPFVIGKLVFKEEPYKYYWVSLAEDPEISFLPFLTEETVVDGRRLKKGVYKGEFVINFVCFDNYGYSDWNSFDEDYDYIVKEFEISDDEVNFDDGSDNSLIISQIDGNLKQNKESQAYYSTSQESNNLTLNNITNTDTEKWSIKGGNSQVVQNYNSTRVESESFDLNDVDNSKTMDIQLKGNHNQETREGYNLLENKSTTQTKNGVTITKNTDGTLVVKGTATSDFTFLIASNIALENGKKYRLSGCPAGGDNKKYALTMNQYYENQSHYTQDYGSGSLFTYNELSANTNSVYIRVIKDVTYNNLIFKPMIIAGENEKEYEQYGATPSLKFPSEIKTVKDNVNLTVANKNYINIENTSKTINGITFTVNSDGSILANGTATDRASYPIQNNFKKFEAGQYFVSGCPSGGSESTYYLILWNENWASMGSEYGKGKLVSLSNQKVKLHINIMQGTVCNNLLFKPQMEKGTKATDYEAHQEQTITMPVQQEMLEGDYFNFDKEKEIHNWVKLTLDGTEDWNLDNTYQGIYQYALSKANLATSEQTVNAYSNYFKGIKWNLSWTVDGAVVAWQTSQNIRIMTSRYKTVDEFKALLKEKHDAGNPVIVYYKLETPIELNFTEKQKAVAKQFKAITPYKNITHIYSTDKIAPKMVVDYNIIRAMPSLDYPSEIETVGKNYNLIGLDDKQYKVNLKAGEYIYVINQSSNELRLDLYTNYGDRERNDFWNILPNTSRKIQVAKTTKALKWATTIDGIAWIVKGENVKPYNKYGEHAIKTKIINKNLFNITANSVTNWHGLDITILDEKRIKINGTTQNDIATYDFNLTNHQTVESALKLSNDAIFSFNLCSGTITNGTHFSLAMVKRNEDNTNTHIQITPSISKIISAGNYFWFRLYIEKNTVFENAIFEIQLEYGSKATDYTAHQEQVFSMPVQQDMLEGDYFDFDREKEVHNWGKSVFDENDNIECSHNDETFQFKFERILENTSSSSKTLCNISKYWKYVWNENGCFVSYQKYFYILCKENEFGFNADMTTNEAISHLKEKLTQNNLICYYQLTTSTELDFTNEQKTVAKQLKRSNFYKGTTNVILDNDLAKVKVNYDGYDGAPSEKHPSSVDGVKDRVDIIISNQNLFNFNKLNTSNSNLTIANNKLSGNNSVAIIGASNDSKGLLNKILVPGTYTVSFDILSKTDNWINSAFLCCQNPQKAENYANGISVNLIANEKKRASFQFEVKEKMTQFGIVFYLSKVSEYEVSNITVVKGTEEDYIEYKQQQISLPLQEEMYVDDYIDETGEHHKMAKIVIDGTNTRVSMTKRAANFIQTYLSTSEQFDPQVDINCYSNIMNQEYNARFGFVNTFIKGETGIYFHFKGDLLGDADCNDIGMNNWFKEQYDKGTPAYIIGPLKKEKVLPLTDEQKSALNILKNYTYSYPGANTISISGDTKPKITASYIPQQDINIDFVLEGSNLLNDSAFYYNNDIYLKAFDEIDSGNPSTSGISSEREVYLYNAGNADASLKLTFDLIIPAENSPLTIVTSKGHFTKNGFEEINNYSQFSISNFAHYKPFVDIFDGVLSNWVIEIDSDLCEVYLKHKTNKDKVISLNRFNDNQSFLKLAGSDFVDYSKSFPTSLEEIKDSAIENTIFNKISLKESAQNYRLKNVSLDWKHTYL